VSGVRRRPVSGGASNATCILPKCSHHMRIGPRTAGRVSGPGRRRKIGAGVSPEDPLKFRDSKRYKDRLVQAQKATGERDALIVLGVSSQGLPIVACALNFNSSGSMGSVVGERFKRAVDHCNRASRAFRVLLPPVVGRMQEALYSLCRWQRLQQRFPGWHRPSRLHLGHDRPTDRWRIGQSRNAGDLNLAEPRALIGFAGHVSFSKPCVRPCRKGSA